MVEWIGKMNPLEFMVLVAGVNSLLFTVCIGLSLIQYRKLWKEIKAATINRWNEYVESVAEHDNILYTDLRYRSGFPFYLG